MTIASSAAPAAAPPLLARLRDDTRAHHERLEALVPVLDPSLTQAGYAAVLAAMRDVYAPLEAAIAGLADAAALGLDLAARRKTPWLDADLAALARRGVRPPASGWIVAADALPATDAAALGALYVVEGATLGGALVVRRTAPMLGLAPDDGCRFFDSYGEARGTRWREFREAVERFELAAPEAADAVVAAALATFAAMIDRFAAPLGPARDP